MIRINFLPINALPYAQISPKGPVSNYFSNRNILTFRKAAEYVQQLPYGFNSETGDSSIIIKEGFGNCTTKHGLIARLAEELSIQVYRCEGFYELTENILFGVGVILEEYGIPYIPKTHCFLKCEAGYVDLTQGNCTGKNIQIEYYKDVYQVKSEQTPFEIDMMYREYYAEICKKEPVFEKIGVNEMMSILNRCSELNKAICSINNY